MTRAVALSRDDLSWAVDQLHGASFLRDLPYEDITAFVKHCRVLRMRTNDMVFRQGDESGPDPAMFILLAGRVALSRAVADQSERRITVHGPQDTFGELSTFDPGPRTTNACCLTDAVLLTITRTAAMQWVAECPAGLGALLRLMARRLRRTQDLWTDLVFVDLPARLARALLELAYSVGERVEGAWRVDVTTQEELARRIGASRESVNRALGAFERRGWIERRAHNVALLDVHSLWQRAGAPATLAPAEPQTAIGAA